MLVQKYLINNSLSSLIKDHGVYPKLSKDLSKISLDYSQIESLHNDKLACECRGLILRKKDLSLFSILNDKIDLNQIVGETTVVAYPFNRFFNYGMIDAYIDINSKISCYEKLDGTLIILYFDYVQNVWHIGTRSVSEADINFNSLTFRQLFELALKESYNLSFNDFTKDLNKNYTYIIELTSYYNRVVVNYNTSNVKLLGVRDNISLNEIDINLIDILIDKVPSYNFSSIKEAVELVESFNPIEHEGVVLCDSNFNRIKIKSSSYVSLHHTINSIGTSKRNLLLLILNEKDDDIISNIPDSLALELFDLKSKFIAFVKNIDMKFCFFKNKVLFDINKRKEFALTLNKFNVKFKQAYWYMFANENSTCMDFIKSKKENWNHSFLDSILENL